MMRRRFRAAVAWLAVVALLGNVLGAFAPAKAAQVVDDILGPMIICTADGAQPLHHDGPPAGHDQSGFHCSSCVLIKSPALAAEIAIQTFPRPPRSTCVSSDAPNAGAFRLSLGGIGCRAPPFVA
jgi:hypothetical protein